mgnify:CR=1 FL=1
MCYYIPKNRKEVMIWAIFFSMANVALSMVLSWI